MNIPKSNMNPKNIAFSGHKATTNELGNKVHQFYYLYDTKKYDCEVELFNISRDKDGNYKVDDAPQVAKSLKGGPVEVNLWENSVNPSFAYRFKLTEKKNSSKVSYAVDNGTIQGLFNKDESKRFNIVLDNRAVINKNGAMQLIMPDGYYPGVVKGKDGKPTIDDALRAKALATVRTHANKLGGNFQGIISRLPDLEQEGISRIVGTPYTKDMVSSHKYWTENAYRVAPDFGSEEDFKNFQIELFKHGINWVADAALVNEGLQGIHISNLLRKGYDSYAKDMFRTQGQVSLGIIPDGAKDYARIKLINSPKMVDNDNRLISNPNYDAKRPTYVQFYDERLTSPEQKNSNALITEYDKNNTDNIYDITQHEDVIYPYHIEVSPQKLVSNLSKISSDNDGIVDLTKTVNQERALEFETFKVVTKRNSKDAEFWDGNVDIPKLHFFGSSDDNSLFTQLSGETQANARRAFDKGALSSIDYAVNSGRYWTKLVSDAQLQYVSKLLAKNNHRYNDIPQMDGLPKLTKGVVSPEAIEAVKSGEYNLRKASQDDFMEYSVKDYITKLSMDLPLETIPAAANLLGILTSPYISKKANSESEIGKSRFDVYETGNKNVPAQYKKVYDLMDSVYTEQLAPMIQNVLGIESSDDASELDKYIINEAAGDLTKYFITKALNPNANITIDKEGNFDFSGVDEEAISMQSIGIPYEGFAPEVEAEKVVSKISAGLKSMNLNEIKAAMAKRFEGRTLNDFRMAEMILDRTEAGLGWRIDAAKDVASINDIRNAKNDAQKTAMANKAWDDVIAFWAAYNNAVINENPHAYTTAEITDLEQFFPGEVLGQKERDFLEKTGITTTANYKYFYSKLPNIFADSRLEVGIGDDNGWQPRDGAMHEYYNKLDTGWQGTPGFLFQSPDDGVKNSYTFVGNHDKPRILSVLGLNQQLYTFNFSDKNRFDKCIDILKNELGAEYSDSNPVDLKLLSLYEVLDAKRDNESMTKANSEKEQLNKILSKLMEDIKDNYRNKKISSESISELSQKYTSGYDNLGSLDVDILQSSTYQHYLAATALNKEMSSSEIIWDKLDSKSIAMGSRLVSAFKDTNNLTPELRAAIANLSQGKFKGNDIHPEAFGTRPFDIAIKSVLDEAEHNGAKFANRKQIEADVLKSVLEPAYDKYYSVYKLMTVLPGSPTDFAGDKVGASGYETKAKNYFQQNRNTIHWEWLKDSDDNKYSFILDAYKNLNKIASLRQRPELSALNDGDTITFADDNTWSSNHYQVQAMLRYNDKSTVMTFTNLSGANVPVTEKMARKDVTISKDDLKDIFNGTGNDYHYENGERKDDTPNPPHVDRQIKHGLNPGDKFANANNPKEIFTVVKDADGKYTFDKPISITTEDYNTLVLYKVN